MFDEEKISQLKQDLDIWFEDYQHECELGNEKSEWFYQLQTVFNSAYGFDNN